MPEIYQAFKFHSLNYSWGFRIDYLHPYNSGCNVQHQIALIVELYHFFEIIPCNIMISDGLGKVQ